MASVLTSEPRPIRSIQFPAPNDFRWEAGKHGVKSVTAYDENGEMAGVPWFAIEFDDGRLMRCNAASVESVWYAAPEVSND